MNTDLSTLTPGERRAYNEGRRDERAGRPDARAARIAGTVTGVLLAILLTLCLVWSILFVGQSILDAVGGGL